MCSERSESLRGYSHSLQVCSESLREHLGFYFEHPEASGVSLRSENTTGIAKPEIPEMP
jgi:hypothetical protein